MHQIYDIVCMLRTMLPNNPKENFSILEKILYGKLTPAAFMVDLIMQNNTGTFTTQDHKTFLMAFLPGPCGTIIIQLY